MQLFDLVSCDRDALPDFLAREGNSDNLKAMVRAVEADDRERLGYPAHVFKGYFTNTNERIFSDYRRRTLKTKISPIGICYELPTIELCRVLAGMVEHAGSRKLREVGAGAGLLSRMLTPHVSAPIRATDKYAPENPARTFVDVSRESFAETALEKGEDILVSWLHPAVEQEFLEMAKREKPENVWHVGQLPGEDCCSVQFREYMEYLGYRYIPVVAKQFSHIDYFLESDHFDMSRTAVAHFTRGVLPDIGSVCRLEDLARYRKFTTEERDAYFERHYATMSQSQWKKIDFKQFE